MEPFTPPPYQLLDDRQLWFNQGFPLIPTPHQQWPLEQRGPTLGHLPLIPVNGFVSLHFQYQMIVITHHRIGADTDGKQSRQLTQLVDNPLAAMLVTLARVGIFPT